MGPADQRNRAATEHHRTDRRQHRHRPAVQGAYERGVRLQIELPPGAVLTGLSRRVFEQGTVIACEGARLDTLQALLEEEERRHR